MTRRLQSRGCAADRHAHADGTAPVNMQARMHALRALLVACPDGEGASGAGRAGGVGYVCTAALFTR
eukprot:365874-Chlamydomonas_euryale.AAC.16